MKKIIILSILLSVTYLIGFVSHQKQLYPKALIKSIKEIAFGKEKVILFDIPLKVEAYSKGDSIYVDRDYFDLAKSEDIQVTNIVRTPRHYNRLIRFRVNEPIRIYRYLCDKNDNSEFCSWTDSSLKVYVPGDEALLEKVVYKDFKTGIYYMNPGGDFCASPILYKLLDTRVTSKEERKNALLIFVK